MYPKLSQHVRVIPSPLAPSGIRVTSRRTRTGRATAPTYLPPKLRLGVCTWLDPWQAAGQRHSECFEWSLVTSMRQQTRAGLPRNDSLLSFVYE